MKKGAGWLWAASAIAAACGGVVNVENSGDGGASHREGSGGASGAGGFGGAKGTKVPASGGSPTHFCGNGFRETGEACDGVVLAGQTCSSETLGMRPLGSLRCTTSCTVDTSGCRQAVGTGGYIGAGGYVGAGGARGSGGSGTGGTPPRDGGTIGDPHVFTPDGVKYDFQAVGEFVLLEDARDPTFAIQVRQEPYYASHTLSVNTAVAAAVGCDRIAFYAGDPATVRVNGVPVRIEAASRLPGGGRVDRDGDAYVVQFPTGEQLIVVGTAPAFLNVTFRKMEGKERRYRGLLGSVDGAPENEFTTRSGEMLPERPSKEDLYHRFGESYRITDAESLFDYAPGTNTAAYTDRGFPHGYAKETFTPEELDRALGACRAARITEPQTFFACVADVAITGDTGFVRAAARSSRAASAHTRFEARPRDLEATETLEVPMSVEPRSAPCPRSTLTP